MVIGAADCEPVPLPPKLDVARRVVLGRGRHRALSPGDVVGGVDMTVVIEVASDGGGVELRRDDEPRARGKIRMRR